MESELQYIVRHVLASWLSEGLFDYTSALRRGDPDALEHLRPLIEAAASQWSKRYRVVVMRDSAMYWYPKVSREDTDGDGAVVALKWGWKDEHVLKIPGEDAFDMAQDILDMFKDADGDHYRPERPDRDPNPDEDFKRGCDAFMEVAAKLRKLGLEGAISFEDVTAWRQSGSPEVPLRHVWQDYPEDHVQICDVCGHYWRTREEDDDYPSEVCSGQPMVHEGARSIHHSDPRRSPLLRNAQRLDRLVRAMQHCEASLSELQDVSTALDRCVACLGDADKARYYAERVGMSSENEPADPTESAGPTEPSSRIPASGPGSWSDVTPDPADDGGAMFYDMIRRPLVAVIPEK